LLAINNTCRPPQALEGSGVKVTIMVCQRLGNGINKQKYMRAVMEHNLDCVSHFIWGDALLDFTNPGVPKGEKEKGH